MIVDSCGELRDEMKESGLFETAPLTMEVGGVRIVDDVSFDQTDFLRRVAECTESPKSSCPSPEEYMKRYCCDAERVYVVTLSAELSGSYNSAVLGKNLYIEEYGKKEIHIFNSCSASIGETLIEPFELSVLYSRIQAVLRRTGNVAVQYLSCDGIKIDLNRRTATCGTEEIDLSVSEYELLLYLLQNKGKTVTREKILEQVWDVNGNYVNDHTLTVTMKRLRDKLHQPSCLKTIRSVGYRMEDTI